MTQVNSQKVVIMPKISNNNIELEIGILEIHKFRVLTSKYSFDPIINEIENDLRNEFTIDSIKETPIISLYRQFYWKFLHIDPTKTRPASEALIRRILHNRSLPKISPFVDAYNWASVKSQIPMGAYDLDKIKLPIQIRYSQDNESFQPIGRKKIELNKGTLVVSDSESENDNPGRMGKILCQYPYRDAQFSCVKQDSKDIVLLAYGAPGLKRELLEKAFNCTRNHLQWLRDQNIIEFEEFPLQYSSNRK
ncbi:MAG: B3/B4 domain-containing protein [Promethearchaeota archaeon]